MTDNTPTIYHPTPLAYNTGDPTPSQHCIAPNGRKVLYRDGWWRVDEVLPPHSVAEIIVTDGKISSVVVYDHHTKSFLKPFGAQCMRVPNPIYWCFMPVPPRPDKIEQKENEKSNAYAKLSKKTKSIMPYRR